MARVRLVPRGEITDDFVLDRWNAMFGEKDPATDSSMIGPNKTRGDYWAALAHSPTTVKNVWDGFGYFRTFALPALYREIGMTRAGYNIGSQFVFSQHCKGLRNNGWSEEKIAHVPDWQTATCYDEVERLLLAVTDDLVLQNGRISDERFEELRKHLSDREIIEFIHATLIYQMHATVCRALRVEFDDVGERLKEVGGGAGAVYTLGQR